MGGLIKKVVVFAAVDGLFLRPSLGDSQNAGIKIEYGSNKITTGSRPAEEDSETGLDSHGIVGT